MRRFVSMNRILYCIFVLHQFEKSLNRSRWMKSNSSIYIQQTFSYLTSKNGKEWKHTNPTKNRKQQTVMNTRLLPLTKTTCLCKTAYTSQLSYTNRRRRLHQTTNDFEFLHASPPTENISFPKLLGHMITESTHRPPLVCVQSIWVSENLILVGELGSSTTNSPTW